MSGDYAYRKWWQLDRLRGIDRTTYPEPARRHIADLRARGVTHAGIADAAGLCGALTGERASMTPYNPRCLPCWSTGTPCREHTDTPPEHVPGARRPARGAGMSERVSIQCMEGIRYRITPHQCPGCDCQCHQRPRSSEPEHAVPLIEDAS